MKPAPTPRTCDTPPTALNVGASTPAGPAALEPVAMTVPHAVRYSGLGRSTLYNLLGKNQIEAVKAGNRTLVLTASIRAYLAGLPAAFPKREG
ncbi:helix-turn-helix domain-containing protein [Azospirillum brasilense]|nr:helix-turn-helix domain-containing protein [Azospirillum brasilense]